MAKLEVLEKRKRRLEGEIKKAEKYIQKYQASIKDKQEKIKMVEGEILAETLVQSGMTTSELQELIGLKKSPSDHEEKTGGF
ncbi:hypothetical protein [Lactococcus lactis]|uniref:hypothetical protein n=1 Tax=Lactococcus lactis TaxID=1358 RepID=UPI001F579A66|nr:hypothetical protein [Lactococcus lactis]